MDPKCHLDPGVRMYFADGFIGSAICSWCSRRIMYVRQYVSTHLSRASDSTHDWNDWMTQNITGPMSLVPQIDYLGFASQRKKPRGKIVCRDSHYIKTLLGKIECLRKGKGTRMRNPVALRSVISTFWTVRVKDILCQESKDFREKGEC